MSKKVTKLPGAQRPTIDEVFAQFLAEERARLKPKAFENHESVIDMLRDHLNNYAYQSLSKAETAFFDKYYEAEGEEHREFCQIFGPEKIVENLGGFLSYFMIRKVAAGADFKRAAGTVTKKLSEWLSEKSHVSEEAGRKGIEEGVGAARDLPKAERAADILREAADSLSVDPTAVSDEEYIDFDHLTIIRLECPVP